jgi:hypothetical protein
VKDALLARLAMRASVAALTLKPVEDSGDVERVLVGMADALDNPALPDLHSLAVPVVDRADQATVVGRLPISIG